MITITNTDVYGFEAAIRGMRNPLESWGKSDSYIHCNYDNLNVKYCMGANDRDLAMRLANAGSTHAKYRRMITVTADITAPLYWWKEFDTYKVGTVANSCSTMHKIHAKEFTLEDFSCEKLHENSMNLLGEIIDELNYNREVFVKTKDKEYWEQMIQLLPSSYNQKRTVMLNYEVLVGMYRDRKNHKLDEWLQLCAWIESLPYAEVITGVSGGHNDAEG